MRLGSEQQHGIRAALLNSIPNVFWSVLCLTPVYLFCSHAMTPALLYIFGGVSLIPYFLPMSSIERMGVSSSSVTYRRLGVAFVGRFTQDGVLVRKFAKRSRLNQSRVVDPAMIRGLRSTASQRERFHLTGFLFFLLLTGSAVSLGKFGWAVLLLACNVIYNIYPVLLQQYIRLRVGRILHQSRRRYASRRAPAPKGG